MKIFFSLSLILFLFSCSLKKKTKYPLDMFCQDLSIALQRIQIHADNIANQNTTRVPEGGHYKKRIPVNCRNGECEIKLDSSPPILKHDPKHPDASKNGYVAYPPFGEFDEMARLKKAQAAYEWVMKNKPVESVDFLVGNKLNTCFKKYKALEPLNHKKFFGRD